MPEQFYSGEIARGGSAAQVARPKAAIPSGLDTLDAAVNAQRDLISKLAVMLGPVLAGEADPSPAPSEKPVGSEVTLRIMAVTSNVHENMQVLQNIMERLEV